MKPLTIEQLKALEVGDWVWVVMLKDAYRPNDVPYGEYHCIYSTMNPHYFIFREGGNFEYKLAYEVYGIDWMAYKNKEQAEAKGEIIEFPVKKGDKVYRYIDLPFGGIIKYVVTGLYYRNGDFFIDCDGKDNRIYHAPIEEFYLTYEDAKKAEANNENNNLSR